MGFFRKAEDGWEELLEPTGETHRGIPIYEVVHRIPPLTFVALEPVDWDAELERMTT